MARRGNRSAQSEKAPTVKETKKDASLAVKEDDAPLSAKQSVEMLEEYEGIRIIV